MNKRKLNSIDYLDSFMLFAGIYGLGFRGTEYDFLLGNYFIHGTVTYFSTKIGGIYGLLLGNGLNIGFEITEELTNKGGVGDVKDVIFGIISSSIALSIKKEGGILNETKELLGLNVSYVSLNSKEKLAHCFKYTICFQFYLGFLITCLGYNIVIKSKQFLKM